MIRKKSLNTEIVIDLTGPDGNAFVMLAYVKRFAEQLGYTADQKKQLREDMTASDYDHLIKVFDEHFGSFVILETN